MGLWNSRRLHLPWYLGRQSQYLGFTQITCGVVLIIFQFIANDNKPQKEDLHDILHHWYTAAPGVWVGAMVRNVLKIHNEHRAYYL